MAITKQQAKEIMEKRGYVFTSECGHGTWVGFSRDMKGIWISTRVFLETEMMDMTAGSLKMLCELKVNKFHVYHDRFDEFEKWAYFYGTVCSEIDKVVEEMDFIPQRVYMANVNMPTLDESKPEKKETLQDRVNKFKKAVIAKGKEKGYDPAMCKKFFEYWSEVSDGGKKMRWEIAKTKSGTFNIGGRLVTWRGNDTVFNAKFKDRDEKKAEKQNTELKTEGKKAKKNELF